VLTAAIAIIEGEKHSVDFDNVAEEVEERIAAHL
jgi:hypothetical protein